MACLCLPGGLGPRRRWVRGTVVATEGTLAASTGADLHGASRGPCCWARSPGSQQGGTGGGQRPRPRACGEPGPCPRLRAPAPPPLQGCGPSALRAAAPQRPARRPLWLAGLGWGRPSLRHQLYFWRRRHGPARTRVWPGPGRLCPAGPEPRGAPLPPQPAGAPSILEAGGRPGGGRPVPIDRCAACRLLPSVLC